jgi:PAS domain S-box-containing protein
MFRARLLDAVEQAAIATDMDGTITYWNSSAEHLYGWSADEVLGRNIAEITVPQIAAERAAEIMAQLVAGKTWAGEFVVQRKDGTTFTADVFDSPVRDADGATIGIIGVSNDVTQRKRAEDALRKSERDLAHSVDQLHAILDLVPVGIAIVDDPACTQLRLNPALARIFGVPAGTIASRTAPPSGTPRPFKLCRDGVEIPGDELPLQTAAATGRPATRQQIDVVRDDGSTIHIIADAVPLFDEQGAVRGAVSAVVDVTQAREIEAELRHANNVKDEFLSLVSHELKTPITIIAGNAEVLEKRAPYIDEESRTAALLDISNESERLSHIIDDLLVLSRLDRGYRFDREPLMVQRIVDRVVTWHRRDLPERKFIVRHGKGIPAALGSPPSVEQVLNNLLSNAEKYSPDDAPVEVSVRRAGDEVEVVVADRGIGILPDELEHLFAPFYRSPRVAAEAAGVGIGLAVCKRLVEAQSGRIWVRPREGGGSEFAFTLPVADGNH